MKHNIDRRIRLSLCTISGMMLLTGFSSLDQNSQNTNWSREKGQRSSEYILSEEESPQWNLDEIVGVHENAVEEIRTAAQEAHEVYLKKQEEERKAEEERRKAEEAAAEEAMQAQNQVSASEQELLAALIFCEAGNQPYEGQVAVGAVVMNRVRSGVYPNTVSEVIYQSGQFTPAMTGWLDSVLYSSGYTASAAQAAADAIAGSNPVGECLYFSTGGYGLQIGDHYFH